LMHERITKYSVIIFAASCLLAVVASFTIGDFGLAIFSVFVIYPSLIVLLGNIAVSDIWNLYVLFRTKEPIINILFPAALCLGRGGCFIYGVFIFLKLEIGVLQDVL